MSEDSAMSENDISEQDVGENSAGPDASTDQDSTGPGESSLDEIETAQSVEEVADDVRDAIRHGEVEEDVSDLLEERLEEVGLHLRPETIDDLAEEIENDVST